VLVRWH